MNVSLTDELERRVDERVRTGLYTSASELVREALRLFFQYEEARGQEIQELNRRITVGLAQLDRGEGIAGDVALQETLARRARKVNGSKRRDRQVLGLQDFTNDDIAALETARAPETTKLFDDEQTR